eukprot:NODE_7224_length_467_cov_55.299043_g6397_i0.p1 GENE.NODE_7224_length_467_cov_55.299043_g6397_i0~~NODE_7224_length_467_cov_55.299043_g6397_i0.p1  ORF type:complete len:97 (-),score=5.47 NODE_7224_length_467_cov_55.299043_g6397_i0:53-343(-)
MVPKDKCIKKFQVKDMVDGSSREDIIAATAYPGENITLPKLFYKMIYCISCAIHARIVRVRSIADRRVRQQKRRPRVVKPVEKKKEEGGAPAQTEA